MGTKAFLSHRHADRDYALCLAASLRRRGIDVWCSSTDGHVQAGHSFVAQMEEVFRSCRLFLCLVSEAGVDGWMRVEVEWAVDRHAHDPEFFVLPFIRAPLDSRSLPFLLRTFHSYVLPETADELASALTPVMLRDIAAVAPNEQPIPVGKELLGLLSLKRFRWHSRPTKWPDSISLLAILETVGASIAFAFAWEWSSHAMPLVILVAVAPLSLARTTDSIQLERRMFQRFPWYHRKKYAEGPTMNDDRDYLIGGLIHTGVIRLGFEQFSAVMVRLTVRFLAVLVTLFRQPIKILRSVPRNWFLLCTCADSYSTLELLPTDLDIHEYVSIRAFWRDRPTENPWRYAVLLFTWITYGCAFFLYGYWIPHHVATLFVALMSMHGHYISPARGSFMYLAAYIGIIFLAPAATLYASGLLLRWSVKASAVVYAPLLWISPATLAPRLPVRTRLKLHCKDAISTFVLLASCVVLGAIVLRSQAVYDGQWARWVPTNVIDCVEGSALLTNIVNVKEIPYWHIVAAVNALLGIGLYFWSSRVLVHVEDDVLHNLRRVDVTLRLTRYIRWCGTAHSVAWFLIALWKSTHLGDSSGPPPVLDEPIYDSPSRIHKIDQL